MTELLSVASHTISASANIENRFPRVPRILQYAGMTVVSMRMRRAAQASVIFSHERLASYEP